MASLDISIIVLYLVVTLFLGFYYQKKATGGLESYFLGNKTLPWWMLAMSGTATNFSVAGTVWQMSMLFLLGMKSYWLQWGYALPIYAFYMAFVAIWIRRTEVMTAAELVKFRFGEDTGGIIARILTAVYGITASAAFIGMAFVVIAKFAESYGYPPVTTAVIVTCLTGAYVVAGGFRSVIVTDFLQATLLGIVSIILAVIAYNTVIPDQLAHNIGNVQNWLSLELARRTDVPEYEYFARQTSSLILVGVVICLSVSAGGFGEQRFLAAKNTSDAAKVGAAWGIMLIPRWFMTAAIVILGFMAFSYSEVTDADKLLPWVMDKYVPAGGIKGLVIAAFIAAFMSTISSLINTGASLMIRDIWQPFFCPEADDKHLVHISYVGSVLIVALGMLIGIICFRSSSLNKLFVWIMTGLGASCIIPGLLRWYWWRTNSWGMIISGICTLPPMIMMLTTDIPWYFLTPVIMLVSFVSCVVGSCLTPKIDETCIQTFYKMVRPFGLWRPVYESLGMNKADHRKYTDNILLIMINCTIGTIALFACYMFPVYLIGHWYMYAGITLAVIIAASIVLYFTWYRSVILPQKK